MPPEELSLSISNGMQALEIIVILNVLKIWFHAGLRAFQMMYKIPLVKHWFPGLYPAALLPWLFLRAQEHMNCA